MLKIFFVGCICTILISFITGIKNNEIYDENYEDETVLDNMTSTNEHDTHGRHEQLMSELRPVYPINHYSGSGLQNNFQELFTYKRPLKRPIVKKRKILKKKAYKFIVPLLLSILTKVANFLPVAKLTLLALFALVLFSKKALLVSIGSLILVIYDNFYNKKQKGTNIVKDRVSTASPIDQGTLVAANLDDGWWGREEAIPSSFDHPNDNSNKNKVRRWWAPQIKLKRMTQNLQPMSVNKMTDDLVLNKLLYS